MTRRLYKKEWRKTDYNDQKQYNNTYINRTQMGRKPTV